MPAYTVPIAPLYTYQSEYDDTTITVANGAGSTTVPLPAPVWNVPAAETFRDTVADALTSLGVLVGAGQFSYDAATSPGVLRVNYGFQTTGNPTTVTFPNITIARRWGFSTVNVDFAADGGFTTTTWNVDGYCMPYTRSSRESRNNQTIIASTTGLTTVAPNIVQWGLNITETTLTHSYIQAANVFRYRTTNSGFAIPAGRNTIDPNNTVEGMLIGTRTEAQGRIRVYDVEDPADLSDFQLIVIQDLAINTLDNLSSFLTDEVSGRLWSLSITGRRL